MVHAACMYVCMMLLIICTRRKRAHRMLGMRCDVQLTRSHASVIDFVVATGATGLSAPPYDVVIIIAASPHSGLAHARHHPDGITHTHKHIKRSHRPNIVAAIYTHMLHE